MNKILLIFLVGSIVLSQATCTTRIAISKNTQRLHHDAQRVDPYYDVRSKSKKAKRRVWLWPLIGAVSMGGLGFLSDEDDKGAPYTPDQRLNNAAKAASLGVGLGLFWGGITFFQAKKSSVRQEKVGAGNFDKWLKDYGQQSHQRYVRYDKGDDMPLVIPRKNIEGFEAEVRRKAEALVKEQQRVQAEARRHEEQRLYNLIMAGKSVDIDAYLKVFTEGAHFSEIKQLAPTYRAYLAAMNGGLPEGKAYMANSVNTFFRENVANRVRQIENTTNNVLLRKQAIEAFLGINRPVDPARCRQILEEAATQHDVLATAWKGFFTYLGLGGFPVDEELGLALAYEGTNTDVFASWLGKNDAEALAIAGLEGMHERNIKFNERIQEIAHKDRYIPALYILGIHAYAANEYPKAIELFKLADAMGMGKAAMMLGVIYGNEKFSGHDLPTAIEWYTKGIQSNDGDAALKMAEIYYNGKGVPPDAQKAYEWALKGADLAHMGSMVFLGKFLSEDHQQVTRDPRQALAYYKLAAEKGDREAMFALGILSYEGNVLGFKDDKQAAYWIPKAAEANHPQAMAIAARFYDEGTLLPRSPIKARFWYNQAKAKGVGSGSYQPPVDSPLEAIFKHGDFRSTYTVVEDYAGNVRSVTANPGSGLMNGLASGIFGSWFDRYQNQQPTINGMEYIMTKNKRKIYAGTLTSRFTTPITLTAGKYISCKSTGIVSMGTFAGNANASGLYDQMLSGYRITDEVNFGAVMGRINGGKWFKIGTEYMAPVEQNGVLELAVNDRDYASHQGYFDVRIEIE